MNTETASAIKKSTLLFMATILLITGCSGTALFAINSLALTGQYDVETNISYGEHATNKLDIYVPELDKTPDRVKHYPVVIFFYGGCWGGCKTYPKEHYRFVAQALTSNNTIVVIPDYRLYPDVRFPQIMDDARIATNWVKNHIHEYGGNPDQLFLTGHSAGAHLAAMLTLNEDYLQPEAYRSIRGFVGLAGPYDFLPFTENYQKEVFGPPERYSESQPVNYVDGNEPPLLLLYGTEDDSVKPHNINNLEEKVRQSGGNVKTFRYAGLDHAGILAALSIPLRDRHPVWSDIKAFVQETIAQP